MLRVYPTYGPKEIVAPGINSVKEKEGKNKTKQKHDNETEVSIHRIEVATGT